MVAINKALLDGIEADKKQAMSREQVIAEVVAEMREQAEYEGPGLRALTRLWADRLSNPAASPSVGAVPQVDYAAIDDGDGTVRIIQLSRTGSDPAMTGDERIMLRQQATLASQAARMAELEADAARWRWMRTKIAPDTLTAIMEDDFTEPESTAKESDAEIDALLRADGMTGDAG